MDEFERRLRDSLHARSEDVDATPDLWLEVQERRERKRRLRWLTTVGVVAAAAVVAVVAVPTALDALRTGGELVVAPGPAGTASPSPRPTPTGPPPPAPSEQPTGPPSEADTELPAAPFSGLATDGPNIYLLGNGGAVGETIYTFPSEGHSTVVSMAVRPGSTTDDLTVVLLTQAEGSYDLRWLTWDGTEATVQLFPDPYNLRNHAMGGSVPAPVWSPDGRHVMWAEDGEEGEPGLRSVGWSDGGPGTGDPADDNAEFGMPILPRGATVQLQDWVWTEGTGTETRGYVTATSVDPADTAAWRIGIERQGDGALALSSTMGSVPFEEDDVLDHADSHTDDGTDTGPTYLLRIGQAGQGDLGLELTWSADDGRRGELPVPVELDQGSDPSSVWMNALGGGVVVGKGDRSWIVTLAGDVRPVEGSVTYADLIPGP